MSSPIAIFRRLARGVRIVGAGAVLQSAWYPLRKAYHTARFDREGRPQRRLTALREMWPRLSQPARPDPPPVEQFTFLGQLRRHRIVECTVELICDSGALWLTILSPDVIRVRCSPDGRFPPIFSYAVAKEDSDWPACEFTVSEDDQGVEIRTERLICRISRLPCRLSFLDLDGAVISEDTHGVGWCGEWVGCWRRLEADEHIYGLGEKAMGLDHRGQRYEMWNTDPYGYGPGCDPLYMSFPVYVSLRQGRSYGLFLDNAYRSIFDIGHTDEAMLSFMAAGGEMRYYFFYGPAPATVLERYTELTGRMPLPPLWALGYHQSRWSYYPESALREIAAGFRSRRIPCDALYFDIHYMDGYRDFTWDRQRFPDPAGLIADLGRQGFKAVAILDPGIKADSHDATCVSGLEHDVFLKYPDGTLFSGPVWPGDCYFPDFTSPRVREWWGEQCVGLLDAGIAGLWNDMNEPVVRGVAGDCPPDHVRHKMDGHGGDHRAAHNVYGMQMARATYEAMRRHRPACRPFVLTRSAFAGVQRYALGWTADNHSTWEDMALSIPMLLNLGLSGLAFVGCDVGGFEGDADGELLVRWTQLGVFMPFFRNHSALLSRAQEPWAFGEPYTCINRRYIELRYQLLPAIYTAFWQCAQSGRPIMRPVFFDWPADERAATIQDEFLFGDHLLIAPVLKLFGMERNVYVPAGEWYDWWDDRLIVGPAEFMANAPLDVLPMYVRAGAVIPMADVVQYVGEKPAEKITLHVFAGNAMSHLYEDAGEGWEHVQGHYRHTIFTTSWDGETLTLSRAVEGPFDPGYVTFRVVVHGLGERSARVTVDGVPADVARSGEPATLVFHVCGEFEKIKVASSGR